MSLQIVRRGFDLRLAGAPGDHPPVTRIPPRVALLGADYPGMRPTMRVGEGDAVERGAVLFEDKKTPGVCFTAPLGGRVASIHRGARRAFVSVVIDVNPDERGGRPGSARSPGAFRGRRPEALSPDDVRSLLLESGEWTAIRSRPFGRVANPARRPASVFVTAMDSAPHAPDPVAAVRGREEDLAWGLAAVSRLTEGPTFVCHRPGAWPDVSTPDGVRTVGFRGPHPAGTAGLHIHRLAPASRKQEAWHLDLQDLASIGRLFRTGSGDAFRRVALAGPALARPRILTTAIGAAVSDLAAPDLDRPEGGDVERRLVSGSVLSGRSAGSGAGGYLGRYHRQVSVLEEDRRRRFLGWLAPGVSALSVSRTFLSGYFPGRPRRLTTRTNGSRRAVVPTPAYDRVMAFDIPAVLLLRALLMEDLERAEELGALELIEEDLGLLTFACPAKNDYAPPLRRVLDRIEKEG